MRTLICALILANLALSGCSQEPLNATEQLIETEQTKKAMEVHGPPAFKDVPVHAAATLVSTGEVTLIDVRREREWKSTGMADGAVGVTLQDADFLDQILAAVDGDKTRPIALICRSGSRSAKAQKQLLAEGHSTVMNVTGGTLAWKKQGLPMQDY